MWPSGGKRGTSYRQTDHRLRGSASTVLTATSQVNGRWQILTPHRIETHLLLLVCVSFTIIGQPWNSVLIRWTRSLSNATFSFLITWHSSSSNSAAVYKISSKSDDFSLRYGDIMIFKMVAGRHLWIVLLPTKSLLLAAAACQISCQSYTHIWR